MNDWWNDPPDEPEYSDEPGSENYNTLTEYVMDLRDSIAEYNKPMPDKCPHGKEWGSCDRCDYEGDIAYDAWREKR